MLLHQLRLSLDSRARTRAARASVQLVMVVSPLARWQAATGKEGPPGGTFPLTKGRPGYRSHPPHMRPTPH